MAPAFHATKQALIDATLKVLETRPVHEVFLDNVLQVSGISVGSLYHHFKDFPDLMDHALVAKYAQFTQLNVEGMAKALADSHSAQEYKDNILKLLAFTHSSSNAELRKTRACILSQATVRPGLGQMMETVQSKLTAQLAEIIAEAQRRGWIQPQISPHIIATFIQAYGVGRIVDDLSNPHMDNDEWIAFLQHMISVSVLNG